MKLISCYIENFGSIRQKEYKFDKELTSFYQSNGEGKTTLADFLKVMFYGMKTYRDGGAFCDRVHYFPFEGGRFGGVLTFEMDGDTYRLERFFDEKSETKDECTVSKNGDTYEGFGDDIGKSIFGIDKESFERTAFVGSKEIEISSTSSINAKLSGFLQGTGDEGNLEEAVKRLDKASKEYKKAKAGKDKISEETARIDELKTKIANATEIEAALTAKYRELSETEGRIGEIGAELKEAQTRNLLLNNWERYEAMLADKEKRERQCKAIEEKYPFGVPTEAEVATVARSIREDEILRAKAESKSFTSEDENRLAALDKSFQSGVPTDERFAEMQDLLDVRAAKQAELRVEENRTVGDKEKRIKQRFNAYLPTADEISEAENKLTEYKKAKKEAEDTPLYVSVVERSQTESTGNKKPLLFAAIGGAVLAVIGAALLFVHLIAGVATVLVGFLTALVCAFLYLNKKSGAQVVETQVQKENPERRAKEKLADELCHTVRAFLTPYGYASDEGVAFDFATFKTDLKAYETLLEDEKASKKRAAEIKLELTEATTRLERFFRTYGLTGENYAEELSALRALVREYADVKGRKEAAEKEAEKLNAQRLENAETLVAFCKERKLERSQVREEIELIVSDAEEYARLRKAIEEAAREADSFKSEKGLTEKPEGERSDIAALSDELQALQQRRSAKEKEIETDELEAEKLDGYRNEKADCEERLKEYKQKYKLLTATIGFLQLAEQNLKDKYVKPVKDEFVKYAALLESTLGERVSMNKNFEVSFERNGSLRSEKHLSAGQRSLCALCFRLAMIGNMYVEQKPFLILDDPFVHLDKEHLEKARAVVKALSGDMQIVYFTCHESRVIE